MYYMLFFLIGISRSILSMLFFNLDDIVYRTKDQTIERRCIPSFHATLYRLVLLYSRGFPFITATKESSKRSSVISVRLEIVSLDRETSPSFLIVLLPFAHTRFYPVCKWDLYR